MVNEVTISTLSITPFNHELISNGKLSAARYADFVFETMEPITSILVKNGEQVKKGQKLAELATFRLNNTKEQAKATLEQAKLELQDVLIGQGYPLNQLSGIPDEILTLAKSKSGYDQALAQYELAVYEKENATILAPFDGIVANLFTKPYNKASTSEIFCTVIDPNSLEAVFTVLESELPFLKQGDKVEIIPFAMPENKTEGYITEINPVVQKNGIVQVKASVRNNGRLFEGMNIRVSVQRMLANQIVIPKEAVVLRSGKPVVFTLVNNKAYWNYVQTGLENSSTYTITEGLKEGDVIITSGNINLAHETPVTIVNN